MTKFIIYEIYLKNSIHLSSKSNKKILNIIYNFKKYLLNNYYRCNQSYAFLSILYIYYDACKKLKYLPVENK